MSRYTIYYGTQQIAYKKLAIRWKRWSETANLSEREREGMSKFFKDIAVRFGLVREFRDIGVI